MFGKWRKDEPKPVAIAGAAADKLSKEDIKSLNSGNWRNVNAVHACPEIMLMPLEVEVGWSGKKKSFIPIQALSLEELFELNQQFPDLNILKGFVHEGQVSSAWINSRYKQDILYKANAVEALDWGNYRKNFYRNEKKELFDNLLRHCADNNNDADDLLLTWRALPSVVDLIVTKEGCTERLDGDEVKCLGLHWLEQTGARINEILRDGAENELTEAHLHAVCLIGQDIQSLCDETVGVACKTGIKEFFERKPITEEAKLLIRFLEHRHLRQKAYRIQGIAHEHRFGSKELFQALYDLKHHGSRVSLDVDSWVQQPSGWRKGNQAAINADRYLDEIIDELLDASKRYQEIEVENHKLLSDLKAVDDGVYGQRGRSAYEFSSRLTESMGAIQAYERVCQKVTAMLVKKEGGAEDLPEMLIPPSTDFLEKEDGQLTDIEKGYKLFLERVPDAGTSFDYQCKALEASRMSLESAIRAADKAIADISEIRDSLTETLGKLPKLKVEGANEQGRLTLAQRRARIRAQMDGDNKHVER